MSGLNDATIEHLIEQGLITVGGKLLKPVEYNHEIDITQES